jgi:phosphoglycolate phosphatase
LGTRLQHRLVRRGGARRGRSAAPSACPLPEAVSRVAPDLPEHLLLPVSDGYKQAFYRLRAAGLHEEDLYPGILDLLTRLDSAGWLLGVATGKSVRGLNAVLETHGLHSRFITLQTADRCPGKPNPTMLHNAMAEAGTPTGGDGDDRRHHVRHGDGAQRRGCAASACPGAIIPSAALHGAGAVLVADHCATIADYLQC